MISSVFKSIFFICRRYSFSIFQRSTLHFQPSKLYIIFYLFYMNFLRRFVRRYLYAFIFNILFTYLFQKTFFRVFISDLFSKNFPIFRQSRTKLVTKTQNMNYFRVQITFLKARKVGIRSFLTCPVLLVFSILLQIFCPRLQLKKMMNEKTQNNDQNFGSDHYE